MNRGIPDSADPDQISLPMPAFRRAFRDGFAILDVIHLRAVAVRVLAVFLSSLAPLVAGGEPSRLPNILAAMAFGYASIGALNDYCDRDLDRQTKPWRALPSGLISQSAMLWLVSACIFGMLLSAWPLGLSSLGILLLMIGMGWLYDLKLKRTVLSWLPYVVGFPLIPLWTWTTLLGYEPRLWWLFPLIGLPAFALHLFNNLEDLEGDLAAGWESGLPHVLGVRSTSTVAWLALFGGYAILIGLAPTMPTEVLARYWILTSLAIALGCIAGARYVTAGDRRRTRRLDYTLLAASVMVITTGFPVTMN